MTRYIDANTFESNLTTHHKLCKLWSVPGEEEVIPDQACEIFCDEPIIHETAANKLNWMKVLHLLDAIEAGDRGVVQSMSTNYFNRLIAALQRVESTVGSTNTQPGNCQPRITPETLRASQDSLSVSAFHTAWPIDLE